MQTKLTYMYGNLSKAKSSSFAPQNSSEDCVLVETAHPTHGFPKNQHVHVKAEDEERACAHNSNPKRLHMEVASPRTNNTKSPSCAEETENDISGNGFVTARMKLVFLWCLYSFCTINVANIDLELNRSLCRS